MADLLVKLYELPDLAPHLAKMSEQGITIRKPIGPENYSVISFIKEHFGEGWASETENAFFRSPKGIYIATEGKKMLGFACFDATAKGFFGPTGVDESQRGKGIGAALLLACLHAMKEEGYGYAIIGGAGPVEFYKKFCGATVIENSDSGIYKNMIG